MHRKSVLHRAFPSGSGCRQVWQAQSQQLEESSHIPDVTPLKFPDKEFICLSCTVLWVCFVTDHVHPEHSPSSHAACLHSPAEWLGHVALGHYLRAFHLSSQEQFQDELMFVSVKHNLKPYVFIKAICPSPKVEDSCDFICPTLELLKSDFIYLTFVKTNIVWPNFPMSLSVSVRALGKEGLPCSANEG